MKYIQIPPTMGMARSIQGILIAAIKMLNEKDTNASVVHQSFLY